MKEQSDKLALFKAITEKVGKIIAMPMWPDSGTNFAATKSVMGRYSTSI